MLCLCEVLDEKIYGERIAIVEDKPAIMNTFGLSHEKWLNVWNIDNRLLTLCYDSLDDEYDRFIVVYDYHTFCEETDVKQAIIWHEVGHAEFPVPAGDIDLAAERKCDELAHKKGYRSGLEKFLGLTYEMAKTLNNQMLLMMTTERIKALNHL